MNTSLVITIKNRPVVEFESIEDLKRATDLIIERERQYRKDSPQDHDWQRALLAEDAAHNSTPQNPIK